MIIVNGSKVGDLNGAFMCIHYNGSSVVDYCISSWDLFNRIQRFKVDNFTTISDHCPLTCIIKCNVKLVKDSNVNRQTLYKYIWNEDSKVKFLMELNSYNT